MDLRIGFPVYLSWRAENMSATSSFPGHLAPWLYFPISQHLTSKIYLPVDKTNTFFVPAMQSVYYLDLLGYSNHVLDSRPELTCIAPAGPRRTGLHFTGNAVSLLRQTQTCTRLARVTQTIRIFLPNHPARLPCT